MNIAWHSLGLVLLVGLLAGAGTVIVFTGGVLGLSLAGSARERGQATSLGFGIAVLCFLLCAAGAIYGIYLIVPQFH
ncbi:hypothetical protein [Rugosimonospora africana]|uniref:Uncharacterized protein n=1 Tax=Rugosimonospora africana TaxID=556532 RepID=A0A8J3QNB8_9ACTN|nr:hypothetical protein [Rugosimonospora africana]GIH14220.1 hypothetical protein Raf01_23920 [Rugosimonospora africana]